MEEFQLLLSKHIIFLLIMSYFFVDCLSSANSNNSSGSGSDSGRRVVDWAYSPDGLVQLAQLEVELFSQIRFGSWDELKWWLDDYQSSRLVNESPEIDYKSHRATITGSHPILTWRMISRFCRLHEILLNSSSNLDNEFYKALKHFDKDFPIPTRTDLVNVQKSILEIQFMYDLKAEDLLQGKIRETETVFNLTAKDAFDMGRIAYESQYFPEALDWLEVANSQTGSSDSFKDAISHLISELSEKHDEMLDEVEQNGGRGPVHYHRFTEKISSQNGELIRLKEEKNISFQQTKNTNSLVAYTELCSGRQLLMGRVMAVPFTTEKRRSKLYCWSERNSDLAWLINPLKMELESADPYIVRIYDVLGPKAITKIKDLATPKMERSTLMYSSRSARTVSSFRTSSLGILQAKNHMDFLEPLNKKIGRITELVVSNFGDPYYFASEAFQMASYAFGGHFQPHTDSMALSLDPETAATVGDRVATFMIYLNRVQAGGNTVFPHLGISIPPVAGSALFWYDLFKNGISDGRTLHAGCPVMLGQKWIVNKWIRLNANFQKRKCSLDRTK